ncbi:MinD-like ATPase involved in chromosome partitioning or flagellar assembly [Microbacterium sp. AG1240]|uniref:AAA family ATPase n=1 Tax=Microbacterium sp. AG1240 TaxID=2183992 RepID=UPI000EAB7468|nr:P-loop NTPase [Microbacterium sp. AG1240]RKT36382.1 MinD-like ATPase involved in chromosome partitioning or flagellar assembly [Microbacterium sp. AG1240]
MTVVVAVDAPRGARLASELRGEGLTVVAVVDADAASRTPRDVLAADADVLVVQASRRGLSRILVEECQRRAVRVVVLGDEPSARRDAELLGLARPLPLDVEGWVLADALASPAATFVAAPTPPPARGSGVIAVWGPHGAPGRSTLAIELAVELRRSAARVALVDADTHAPALAVMLGLADEGPGFAAACRQVGLAELDDEELRRISVPIGAGAGRVDVLTGINRPGRWPELTHDRVTGALRACRRWADHVVVDVAASLETDEEIVSDLDGPRRNAATLGALREADMIVAVLSADPVGVSRFLRAHAELRAAVGTTRVVVVANRMRPGTLGVDARGQVRRTLERFAGIEDVWFVPLDPRSADAAVLAARPVAETSPRSPLAAAVRRVVGEAVAPAVAASAAPRTRRGSIGRRVARTA